ncbi:MAG: hydantoinase/oxoprolinase family protein [Candidatus Vecturithrix sp.]|jgi:N-methylhydantoinase A/oxoprolinase/acetone carboxylase beta subunit|nr:hydantoinase/oxoprolinase family protein [Candidatus Vecturithrix sp.]
MIIGLDVGGTHTDVVLMEDRKILSFTKAATNHQNLLDTIRQGLADVLHSRRPEAVERLHLSTTLSTNAIVENTLEPVGVLASAGPGIHPQHYRIGEHYSLIDGGLDHRGTEIRPLNSRQLHEVVTACQQDNIKLYAVISKFSPRNPAHEQQMCAALNNHADYVTVGHHLSGQLNFPRRIATAYYNSAVWRIHTHFADAMEQSLQEFGLRASVHILKADGGTMPMTVARKFPVESILSGPAASVMGILALCDIYEDAVILDIGGTTTDIAIFTGGVPLIEPQGMAFNGHQTLVRALKTRSIGIGGDSALHLSEHGVTVGPNRLGPAMAQGGQHPTLIDACNVKGIAAYGDIQASQAGLRQLAASASLSPEKLAEEAIQYAARAIRCEAEHLLTDINARPVYTIHEFLEKKTIRPQTLYVMGGPAQTFSQFLAAEFSYPIIVPENYAVANAVGAALTRQTIELELFADTEKKVMLIPTLNVQQNISGRYSLEDAKQDAVRYLHEYVRLLAVREAAQFIEVTEAESFTMVNGFQATGRNIRVKCQIKPGIRKN